LQQVQLVADYGYSSYDAYTVAGSQDGPCAEYILKKLEHCFFSAAVHNLWASGHAKKDQTGHPNHKICYQLYSEFMHMKYTYLLELNRDQHLPHIPLPICLEVGIKRAFPNRAGKAYVATGLNEPAQPKTTSCPK